MLGSFLALGEYQNKIAPLFASSKIYGQFLAEQVPNSQRLDAAVRSNCKWLWSALNDPTHDAADLLHILQVNRIEDYQASQQPSVIRKHYKAAKKLLDKAKAAGLGEDATEEEIKQAAEQVQQEQKAQAQEELKTLRDKIKTAIQTVATTGLTPAKKKKVIQEREDAATIASEIIVEFLGGTKTQALQTIFNELSIDVDGKQEAKAMK